MGTCSLWDASGSSAAGEFGVGENTATVKGVRVLRNVSHMEVVLRLAQLLSDLWIDVVLGTS